MSPEQLSLFGAPAAPAPKKRAEKEAAEKIVVPSAASAAPAPVDPLSLPEPPKDRPQERMAWLTSILEHHNYLYHTLDKPVISDDQYMHPLIEKTIRFLREYNLVPFNL